MAKIYNIKTGKEIIEPIELTARQLADKLYEVEDQLRNQCLYVEADAVRHAITKLMPRVVYERRSIRRAKQSKLAGFS